jgi:hypothetical protein
MISVYSSFSQAYIKKDTNSSYRDTTKKERQKEDSNNDFYKKLMSKAYKKSFTKSMYKLFFKNPYKKNAKLPKAEIDKTYEEFDKFEGKIISSITIISVEPFDKLRNDSIINPSNKFQLFLNKLHHNTKHSYLRKKIKFSKGDTINTLKLIDNQNLIRELQVVHKAYFMLYENPKDSSKVDMYLLEKDKYSWGGSFGFGSFTNSKLKIYNKNLFGLGHYASARIIYKENDSSSSVGYELGYRINGIGQKKLDVDIRHDDTYVRNYNSLKLGREFNSYSSKYSGIVELSRTKNTEKVIDHPSISNVIPLDFDYFSLWLGREFKTNIMKRNEYSITKLYLSARYNRRKFFKRPDVGKESNKYFHNYHEYLLNIALGNYYYVKNSLVYSYGKVEDIPLGNLVSLNLGFVDKEFDDRFYTGIEAKQACLLKKTYLMTKTRFDFHFDSDHFDEGMFEFKSSLVSDLYSISRSQLRNFVDLYYLIGIRRFPEEFVNINGEKGIAGFESDSVFGKQKLSVKLQNVLFTPLRFLGYKLALFTFADCALIGSNTKSIFDQDFYTGFGLGVRLRNDMFILNSIQFSFGFYPNAPSDLGVTNYKISNPERGKFEKFIVKSPGSFTFR